jgi:hypothetical protein
MNSKETPRAAQAPFRALARAIATAAAIAMAFAAAPVRAQPPCDNTIEITHTYTTLGKGEFEDLFTALGVAYGDCSGNIPLKDMKVVTDKGIIEFDGEIWFGTFAGRYTDGILSSATEITGMRIISARAVSDGKIIDLSRAVCPMNTPRIALTKRP